jgi:hypothetical protein
VLPILIVHCRHRPTVLPHTSEDRPQLPDTARHGNSG